MEDENNIIVNRHSYGDMLTFSCITGMMLFVKGYRIFVVSKKQAKQMRAETMDEMNAVSKISLYERVADLLEERILSDGYEYEKKLPSEQALAEQYSVSRTVIREALKLLKERGLVDSRNGMGSYVRKPEVENLADVIYRMAVLDKISYAEIYGVRKILETAACRMAASTVKNEQLARMRGYLEELKDRSISVKERRELDYNFHAAIAEASGNRLLAILVRTTRNVFLAMIEKGIFTEGGIEDAILRHEKIMRALVDHDPAAAEKAMQEHLDQSYENVIRYMSQQTVPEQ